MEQPTEHPEQNQTISILQWNVLAAGLEGRSIPKWGNINVPESRSHQIATKIIQYQPDIICLQELNHFEDLNQFLSAYNYTGLNLLKPEPSAPHIRCDGVGIFWSNLKFKLNSTTSIKEPARWNQVCLALLLESLETKKTIMIATTHLKATQREELEAIRCQQVIHFTDTVEHWLTTLKCEPHFLCFAGDLNSTPEDPTGHFQKEWKGAAIKEFEKRGYKSGWHVYEAKRNFKADDSVCADVVTFRVRGEVALYDYIMFKGKGSVVSATGPQPWSYPALTTTNHPSDHLPLYVSFQL